MIQNLNTPQFLKLDNWSAEQPHAGVWGVKQGKFATVAAS